LPGSQKCFLSVKLAEESQELVSFVVPHGQFSFTSLCAGLNLAPAIYSQLGSEILGDMRFTEVWNWIDDFTGVCKSFEHGLDLLRRILERFRAYNFRLNPNKCKIFQSEARVLGVLVSRDGVREDHMRAEKMLHWAFPSTTKQMRKLMGWLQFGKNFYENVSHVIRPLTDCLKGYRSPVRRVTGPKGYQSQESPVEVRRVTSAKEGIFYVNMYNNYMPAR
jgi:hypothetical protein